MLILAILLWLMSFILFFYNMKNEKSRWASYIGFFGGCGGLSVLLKERTYDADGIILLHGLFSSFGHYLTPYAILVFGLVFSDTLNTKKKKRIWKILLLVPVVIMYILYQETPQFKTNFVVLALWTVPYVLVSNTLMIYSAYRETTPVIKTQRILACLVIVPMTTFALFTNIILEAVGIARVWVYNPFIIMAAFLLFIFFIIKYGFLGIQLRFEKQKIDSTMKAAISGTALLNHTIKNEVAKIDFLANQLKEQVPNENIDLMLKSTNHILELSSRIQNSIDIMELKESEFWLSSIINSSINLLPPSIISDIQIIKKYESDIKIYADPVHIQEASLNIMKNAIEAMNGKGLLLIKIYQANKKIYIDFKDNGKGIEKEDLSRVIEPFYSTKKKIGNYGLGLSYCYNVAQKHGGTVLVKSEVNQGTTITLSFPIKRMIDIKTRLQLNSKLGEEKL
ncbi:HAMP domain-containing sensor histidine kinase [Metabacillus fastidiosus]|uniref:sensor histidine kinase n=1 Tax=Metabacillus fastidiosus TaxID=1458 RepID=UPI002E228812|nr:HAMP domain-containing sensor histidine kinase [Metabacillus fastidiosus]